MSRRTPDLLIEDIIDSGSKILDYTKNLSFEDSEIDKLVNATRYQNAW